LYDLTFEQPAGTQVTDVTAANVLLISGKCFPSTITDAQISVTFTPLTTIGHSLINKHIRHFVATAAAGTWQLTIPAKTLTAKKQYECVVTHEPSQAQTNTTFKTK